MENDIVRMLFLRRQRQKKRWKIKTISGAPPLSFKAKAGALKDYRIYGNTVDEESVGDRTGNLFDMKKFAELCYPRYASVTFADNTLSFTSTAVDAYVNYVCGEGDPVNYEYRPSCIDVLPSTTYTISMSSIPKCYISWIDNSYKAVSAYTRIPTNQKSYTFTTPSNCTKLLICLGKEVTNIGDTFTISNIMLNEGSTPLPYEPYGESVGDRTGNLFDGVIEQGTISADGTLRDVSNRVRTKNFIVLDAGTYMIQSSNNVGEISVFIFTYTDDGTFIERLPSDWIALPYSFTLSERAKVKIVFEYTRGEAINPSDVKNIMLNTGSTPLPYEPYGYKVPVTISNGTDTQTVPIYLPEQIRKVGEEAEYISYDDQKLHRIGADDIDVNLPELPTLAGTNELTVGTAVQPSDVYIKGKIKKGE